VPVYVTSDGSYLLPGQPLPLNGDAPLAQEKPKSNLGTASGNTAPAQNAPKSDKPVVELFVMSYCPYGTQMEKGILPVVKLLGDKIDFKIKMVYYAMHGEKEVRENVRQYCIQKEQKSKFLDYLTCFLKAGDAESCLTETKVNKAKLDTCTAATDKEFSVTKNLDDQSSWLSGRFPLFNVNKADNEKYGVGGSPTLIINGQQSSSGRDSASLLKTICGAFNDAPKECDSDMSSASPSSGFGFKELSTGSGGNSGAPTTAAGCGV